MLHNFCHWLPGSVAENEYTWASARISQYLDYLAAGGPHLLLNWFSHYGHYGVALFLFLSGYGLVKKYEQSASTKAAPALPFLLHQALKLWGLMVPVLLVLWLRRHYVISHGEIISIVRWPWTWQDIAALLTFTANLGSKHEVIMGPWWWFSLMMQFYVVYRLLLYRRGKAMLLSVTGICLAVQLVATYLSLGELAHAGNLCHHLHYNFPCSILPFALGIWAARYGADWLLSPWAALAGVAVVVAGSFTPWAWAVAGPFAVAAMLQGRKLPLCWLGTISAWVFAVHPIMRECTIGWAKLGDHYFPLLGYVTITLATAALVTYITKRLPLKP